MARTRKLLEALGEVEPRKFHRLSKYVAPDLTGLADGEEITPGFISIDDIMGAQPMTVPTTLLFHMPLQQQAQMIPAEAIAAMAIQIQNNIDEKILEIMLEELKQQEAIDGSNKGC